MSAAAQCQDLVSTAQFLGFAPQRLHFLVGNNDSLYFKIEIPKRDPSNNPRIIHIPVTELKGVQRVILRRVLEPTAIHDAAYAYVKGRSAVAAARKMQGRKYIIRVDLKNFFPTISQRRIFGLFRALGFNNKAAYLLSSLTTYRGSLCQGAPTSPYLSNLICKHLDEQLQNLAKSWQLSYIRYSDDLFLFSSAPFNHIKLLEYVYLVLGDHGFAPNLSKTRFFPAGQPCFILGLMTHGKKVQLPRSLRRSYRAAFFKASTNLTWAERNYDKLKGMSEYHKCVYGADQKYREYRRILENVRRIKLHQAYLA